MKIRNSVVSFLEDSCLKYRDKVAVIGETDGRRCEMTYSELLDGSRRIATYLAGYDTVGRPVAVYMDKSPDVLCLFMGIATVRAFYSMINPQLPDARKKQIAQTLETEIVVTDLSHKAEAESVFSGAEVIAIEEMLACEADCEKVEAIRMTALDTDPLYANFTSGSTGTPKGVLVGHRSVIDFIEVFTETFGIDRDDIIANQAPWDFDVSTKDIYSALAEGATLLIVPREKFSRPMELMDWLGDNRATVLIWAVSALCLVTAFHGFDYRKLPDVKKVLFSGEVMPYRHLKQWRENLEGCTFVNLYGPTEITCNCTYHVLEQDRDYSEGIPLGRSFLNEEVFLLDENDRTADEPGMTGEICVRGTALALGYYNNISQTEKAFVQNPLQKKYRELIYRTGDLGRYTENGELMFAGRKDFQIKYQGHRIELEEIELNINRLEGVDRCCCIFNEEKQKLTGYYTGTEDGKTIRKKLKEILPAYMIPSSFVQKSEFPLNKNGKVDRKALAGETGE